MENLTQFVIGVGLFCSGTCMFVGVLLGFITDELRQRGADSPLVRFSRVVAVAAVLIGLALAVLLLGVIWP